MRRLLFGGALVAAVVTASVTIAGDARAMCGCMVGRRPPPATPDEEGFLLTRPPSS